MARPLDWQLATVAGVHDETDSVRSFSLTLPNWAGHRPGQHVDLRLTAEDGYSVERSYSIASEPERAPEVDITVERIPDGEVSPFLHDVVVPGDHIELRGPIGGYFVWDVPLGGPLLLVGGGSGIVPLRAMLFHRAALRSSVPVRLLYSARTLADVIYREELIGVEADHQGADIRVTLTREQPSNWRGYAGRIDRALLEEVAWAPSESPLTYVCGPTGLVEAVASTLVELGHEPRRIKTERFGPT